MNKQALADWVHGKLGGTKVQAEEIVDGLFNAIIDTLKKGGEVSIAGFGIFSVKARAARMARNPKTGEQVKVAAKKSSKIPTCKRFERDSCLNSCPPLAGSLERNIRNTKNTLMGCFLYSNYIL